MTSFLISKKISSRIPKLYDTEQLESNEVKVPVKLFNPVGSQTWYITEYNPEQELAFGFCNLGDDDNAELGYISIDELESLNLPFGLRIERDIYWDSETKLSDVMSFKKR